MHAAGRVDPLDLIGAPRIGHVTRSAGGAGAPGARRHCRSDRALLAVLHLDPVGARSTGAWCRGCAGRADSLADRRHDGDCERGGADRQE
jgi:hypothetical protein